MSKLVALLFITMLAVLSLIMVESAFAQSTPKPSVPQFIVEFVNASYSVTTTNPYTGVNETQLISNNTIEVTIENQTFGYSSSQIYYNIRVRPHFGNNNWTEIYPLRNLTSSYNGNSTFSYAMYINPDSPTKSSSSKTIVAYPVVATEYYGESGYDVQRYYSGDEGQEGRYFAFLHGIPDGAVIDFQVEALVGHAAQSWYIDHPFYPTIGGHYVPAVGYDSTSGWSETRTISIPASTLSPPDQTPVPSMSIISPLPVTYRNASVPLYFGTNVLTGDPEVVYLRYSIDGNANVTLGNLRKTGTQNFAAHKTGVTHHVEEMLNNLGEGNHTLRVYSHDANGNEMSGSVEFTVDTHNETSTQTDNFFATQNLLLLTTIASVVVVGAGVLVYIKKHKR